MAVPNISLAQFNKIATGDYNAGLVDFKTDDNGNVQNALKKVNHHVHKTGENNVVLSPERILEVKEAFIQALRGGGIDEASINEVRAKLGIPVETKLTTDRHEMKDMMEARFRPLTRQYVRVLLDRYASGGVGRTAESLAAVSPKDFAAAKKTARRQGDTHHREPRRHWSCEERGEHPEGTDRRPLASLHEAQAFRPPGGATPPLQGRERRQREEPRHRRAPEQLRDALQGGVQDAHGERAGVRDVPPLRT